MKSVLLLPLLLAGCSAARFNVVDMMAEPKAKSGALPVVLWHGMGDSCCSDNSIGALAKMIHEKLGVYVYSINTGTSSTESSDVWSSFFGNVNDQVAKVCQELRAIKELEAGYNAVGFSQGGQFLRAVVERCQHTGPQAKMLITMGSQHQGVSNIPGCLAEPADSGLLEEDAAALKDTCQVMQSMLARGAYSPLVRDNVVQAQYFKDPKRMSDYLKYNIFLPDVNNEREDKNMQYKKNLQSLEKFVMFKFTQDSTVVPADSAWFSFFDESGKIVPVEELDTYKEDWIGLKSLDQAGALIKEECPGRHMQFSMEWFEENVVDKYLAESDIDTDDSDDDVEFRA